MKVQMLSGIAQATPFEFHHCILHLTLKRQYVMPARNLTNLADFKEKTGSETAIIIDGVEHSPNVPKGMSNKKKITLGKKRHTYK
jgi:hypothetical protein